MLNIWRLQLLVQFYNLKTMRAVAEVMHISTAAVSVQLKDLEAETKSVLLEKRGRNVHLTDVGMKLVKEVKPILDQLEKVNNGLINYADDVQGTVRIVGFDSVLRTIVMPALAQVKQKYPGIKVSINEQEPEASVTALNAHQFDLAIIAKFNETGFLEQNDSNNVVELGSDKFKVIVNADNPLASNNKLSVSDLKNENWILESPDTYISKYLDQLCSKAHFKPKVLGTCQSYTILQSGVINNLAVGVLPELAITSHLEHLSVIDFIPETRRHIYLVSRKPQASIKAIQLVSAEIKKQANIVLGNK